MFRSGLVGAALKIVLAAIVVFDLVLLVQVARPPTIAPTESGGNVAPVVAREAPEDREAGERSTADEPPPQPANTGGSRPSDTRNEPERDPRNGDTPAEGPSRTDTVGSSVATDSTDSGSEEPDPGPSEGPTHTSGGGGQDEGEEPPPDTDTDTGPGGGPGGGDPGGDPGGDDSGDDGDTGGGGGGGGGP